MLCDDCVSFLSQNESEPKVALPTQAPFSLVHSSDLTAQFFHRPTHGTAAPPLWSVLVPPPVQVGFASGDGPVLSATTGLRSAGKSEPSRGPPVSRFISDPARLVTSKVPTVYVPCAEDRVFSWKRYSQPSNVLVLFYRLAKGWPSVVHVSNLGKHSFS